MNICVRFIAAGDIGRTYLVALVAALLARSQYPEGPATGHLGTGFSWFSCVYKRMLRWFQHSKLLLHASHVALLSYIS